MPDKPNQLKGHVIWCSGMSGSGKTILTKAVKELLESDGYIIQILDGDKKRANDKEKLSFDKQKVLNLLQYTQNYP